MMSDKIDSMTWFEIHRLANRHALARFIPKANAVLEARAALSSSTEAAAGEFIPNTCAGFRGGFIALNKRAPTDQEVWNAGVKSAIQRYAPPAASGQKLAGEQRDQLELIDRCDPTWLVNDIRKHTHFDAKLLERVFDLAKERARSLLAASDSQGDAA